MSVIFPTIGNKRLSQNDNYERPPKTITESIQNKKDIEQQLQDFEEISDEDLNFINVNTLLRYISYDVNNRKELFRFGGLLVKVNKDYVVLAGKEGKRFSAQRYTRNAKNEIIHVTRFFKKIKDVDLLKMKCNETLENQFEIIEKQNKEIEELRKKLKNMKK
jgi:hypothetical protein